jgi:hypothetical protein
MMVVVSTMVGIIAVIGLRAMIVVPPMVMSVFMIITVAVIVTVQIVRRLRGMRMLMRVVGHGGGHIGVGVRRASGRGCATNWEYCLSYRLAWRRADCAYRRGRSAGITGQACPQRTQFVLQSINLFHQRQSQRQGMAVEFELMPQPRSPPYRDHAIDAEVPMVAGRFRRRQYADLDQFVQRDFRLTGKFCQHRQ